MVTVSWPCVGQGSSGSTDYVLLIRIAVVMTSHRLPTPGSACVEWGVIGFDIDMQRRMSVFGNSSVSFCSRHFVSSIELGLLLFLSKRDDGVL